MRLLVAIPKTADFSVLVIKQAKLGMPSCSVIGRLIGSHASPVVTIRIKVGNALPFGVARTGKYCSSWILVGTWEPEMVSTRPLLRKFAFVTLSAQAEGLLDCSRWLSAAIPPDRNHKCATDPGGVAEILASLQDARIPRLLTRGLRSAATPGYPLPTLRVGRSERTNDQSSATRRTGRNDCQPRRHAGFAAAHG